MNKRHTGINRTDRLNGEFQREIYQIIARKLKNPLVTEMFSVTSVETARDLSHAKVYLSIFSSDENKKIITFNAIKEDSKKIRYELAKSMQRIRTVPELHFILDGSMEYGDKMDKLFLAISKTEQSKQ